MFANDLIWPNEDGQIIGISGHCHCRSIMSCVLVAQKLQSGEPSHRARIPRPPALSPLGTHKEDAMPAIFHVERYKSHLSKKVNGEDLLLALQLPVALIALAVLFFLR